MRLSVRPKLGIILSLVTILTVVSGFIVVAIASHGQNASIAGNPEVEFELINLVVAEYNVNGVVQKSALLPSGKENLNNFFNEPNTPFSGGELVSDPRCIYDKPTGTFFFSVVAACSPAVGCTKALESHIDLIVYNATSGAAREYKIDDTFPTQPG